MLIISKGVKLRRKCVESPVVKFSAVIVTIGNIGTDNPMFRKALQKK